MSGVVVDPELLANREAYERWARERAAPAAVHRMPADGLGPGSMWLAHDRTGDTEPIVVYVHGGGFRVGSPSTGAVIGAAVAERVAVRVLVLGYGLSPEQPFPAAANGVTRAIDDLLTRHPTVPVVLAGDSAGANLVLYALRHSTLAAARVRGAALLCPLVDLSDAAYSTRSSDDDVGLTRDMFAAVRRDYLAGVEAITADHPDVSPLLATLDRLPALFVQYSVAELIAPSITAFETSAASAGIDVTVDRWDGQQHFWQRFVRPVEAAPVGAESGAAAPIAVAQSTPDAAATVAIERLAGWLRERLSAERPGTLNR